MPGPSDIRVNPFNNATNYVNLTERHIVPSVSPFVVRLNEVPEKQDPSNMQMFYVDDTTGQTTETALTEVAATPGAGEFRPDYSTNAFDDTSWNTGLIEFSSADAGKIIEVSYTATGTLAGVKTNRYPAWWTDRGDGSDGDVTLTNGATLNSGAYRNVFIPVGVSVNLQAGCTHVKCTGTFICDGTINGNGKGAAGGATYSTSGATRASNPGGLGENSASGSNGTGSGASAMSLGRKYTGAMPEELQNFIENFSSIPIIYGGGGSSGYDGNKPGNYGGAGGGGIVIVAKNAKISGTISVNGLSGNHAENAGGDGGGGGILVIAETVIDNGTYSHTGGYNGWHKIIEMGVM